MHRHLVLPRTGGYICRWSNRKRIVGSRQVNRLLARGRLARGRSSIGTASLLAGGFGRMTFDAGRRRCTSFFTSLFRRTVAKADGGGLVQTEIREKLQALCRAVIAAVGLESDPRHLNKPVEFAFF
jgi:hypothetical protein